MDTPQPDASLPASIVIDASNRFTIKAANLADIETRTNEPVKYRLGRRPNGELVLQGAYYWQNITKGTNGLDWEDLPTIDLPADVFDEVKPI